MSFQERQKTENHSNQQENDLKASRSAILYTYGWVVLLWWRLRFQIVSFSLSTLREQRFQTVPFSNRSTLESVLETIRFRWSFSAL